MREATIARSRCTCGHTGDGPHSQHFDTPFAKGHGECRLCDCQKFTWKNWTRYGEWLARLIKRERTAAALKVEVNHQP